MCSTILSVYNKHTIIINIIIAQTRSQILLGLKLGPSINGLVTDGNTKLCCCGFVLTQFQSTTANKIDSESTGDYTKLFPVCKVEILQVTIKS